ncbi:MAG: nitroreductase family protein [Longimicrobiales bacterium]
MGVRASFGEWFPVRLSSGMDVATAIAARRSIKRFTDRRVDRAEIEQLLDAAVQAPNHRMTEPWRFYVLGAESRQAYGTVLGQRKAKKIEDGAAGAAVVEKVAREHAGLPAMIAVAMLVDENPEIREEDYASTMMAIQNLSLAAAAMGLGVHIKSGAVMDEPLAREAVGVPEGQRIVATIHLGEPAEIPSPKPRHDAREFTQWMP